MSWHFIFRRKLCNYIKPDSQFSSWKEIKHYIDLAEIRKIRHRNSDNWKSIYLNVLFQLQWEVKDSRNEAYIDKNIQDALFIIPIKEIMLEYVILFNKGNVHNVDIGDFHDGYHYGRKSGKRYLIIYPLLFRAKRDDTEWVVLICSVSIFQV